MRNIGYIVFFVIFQFFILAYTFVVNDVADKSIDIKSGKIKSVHKYSDKTVIFILSILAIGLLFIPLYFGNLLVRIISIAAFLSLTFYSVKPVRFKERGFLGIIVVDGAQRSLLFLIFALFISADILPTIFFFCWLFIIGFQDELGHQLRDIENDEKADVRTWARCIGFERAKIVLIAFLVASLFYLFVPFLFLNFYTSLAISSVLFIFRARTYIYVYG